MRDLIFVILNTKGKVIGCADCYITALELYASKYKRKPKQGQIEVIILNTITK